jgi:hypothetical protein
VDTPFGTMRVDNMARQRITRVSVQLRPTLTAKQEQEEEE